MSHTTYNNVQLFHCHTKPLVKYRKTLLFSWSPPSLYDLFQIHDKPPKGAWFQNQIVLFPLSRKETTSHVLLSFAVVYLGNGGHPWVRGVPSPSPQGHRELRAGQPGHGVCSLSPSPVSCEQLQLLRARLPPGLAHSWLLFTGLKISWMEKVIFTVQNKCAFPPNPWSVILHIGWKVVGKWWHYKENKQGELRDHSLSSWQKSCQNNEDLIQLIKY